jgi:hypothetical protein
MVSSNVFRIELLPVLLVALCVGAQKAQATPILTFEFGDGSFDGDTLSPTNVASNIDVSDLQIGPGITSTGYISTHSTTHTASGAPAYQGLGTWSNSFESTDYFAFTVEPDDGYTVDLDTLTFYTSKNNNGADSWEVRLSPDGFSSTIDSGSGIYQGSPGTEEWTNPTVNLGLNSQTNLVEIRIYFYNGSTGNTRLDDVTIDGSVQLIPEAQSSLLMLLGLGLILGMRCRNAEWRKITTDR